MCLVILLEFIRHLRRMYDDKIVQEYQETEHLNDTVCDRTPPNLFKTIRQKTGLSIAANNSGFIPTVGQQAVRAGFQSIIWSLSLFILMLAMSFNGWMVFAIGSGAWIGFFLFTWETVNVKC
jgi:copper transporter 1